MSLRATAHAFEMASMLLQGFRGDTRVSKRAELLAPRARSSVRCITKSGCCLHREEGRADCARGYLRWPQHKAPTGLCDCVRPRTSLSEGRLRRNTDAGASMHRGPI